MAQSAAVITKVAAEKYKVKVNSHTPTTIIKIAFMKLVAIGGLSLLLSVGISATAKPICAAEMT
jgi:hypothetical protein